MTNYSKGFLFSALTATAVALSGCGGSGSGPNDATGFLSLGVSDGPIHGATKVCIEFTEIEFKGEGPSEVVVLDAPEKVNLLDFQGANAAPILAGHELPAGNYNWMRLGINAVRDGTGGTGDADPVECDGEGSYMVMKDTGLAHNLYVPSSANNGLKLVSGFTVPANGTADFTAEFDLAKSLTAPPGLDPDVVMRPTIRLVNNVEVGTLTGQVANELATADACEPSVYLFDDGAPPNAIVDGEDDPDDPVATAMVNEQSNDDGTVVEYHYSIGFLLPGDYEAAFTCDGAEFEPADGKPATIVVGELTTVDFEVPVP